MTQIFPLTGEIELISQDGDGGKVTSDRTLVERKREIEAGDRGRLNDEKEIAARCRRTCRAGSKSAMFPVLG